MTEAEKKRLEELLSDETDLLMVEVCTWQIESWFITLSRVQRLSYDPVVVEPITEQQISVVNRLRLEFKWTKSTISWRARIAAVFRIYIIQNIVKEYCYTSQLKYVFRLMEKVSRTVGQNSLTLREQQLELSIRTWSGRAPWNRGKFVDWSRGKQWDLIPRDPQCSPRRTVFLGPGIKLLMFDNILLYRMLTLKDYHYQLVRGLLWTVSLSLHSPI